VKIDDFVIGSANVKGADTSGFGMDKADIEMAASHTERHKGKTS
jgi:hypothetical protein